MSSQDSNTIVHVQNNACNYIVSETNSCNHYIVSETNQANLHIVSENNQATNTIEAIDNHYVIYIDIIDNRILYAPSGGGGDPTGVLTCKNISSSYTALTTDDVLFVSPNLSNITITLYSPINNIGKKIVVKKKIASQYNLIINVVGNGSIDGASTSQLYYENESFTLISDGQEWCIT